MRKILIYSDHEKEETMNKHLFTRAFLLATAACIVLFFVGCDGDNSVSSPTIKASSLTTSPFSGNWNITFANSNGSSWGGGSITIESNGHFGSKNPVAFVHTPFGGTAYTVDGTVHISGTLTGRIVATRYGGQAGSFTGNLSGNSGSGTWTMQSVGSGTWSASKQ